MSPDFNDGIRWICQGDYAEALGLLRRYAHRVGRDNYASARPTVDEFLRNLNKGILPIPLEEEIELLYGHIRLDYNHRLKKRMGDALKRLGRKIIPWRKRKT